MDYYYIQLFLLYFYWILNSYFGGGRLFLGRRKQFDVEGIGADDGFLRYIVRITGTDSRLKLLELVY